MAAAAQQRRQHQVVKGLKMRLAGIVPARSRPYLKMGGRILQAKATVARDTLFPRVLAQGGRLRIRAGHGQALQIRGRDLRLLCPPAGDDC